MDLEAVPSTAEERARRCRDYVDALEEERRKIQVFQRELPLSVHLVTQTIESYRQQIAAGLFAAGGVILSQEQEEEEAEMLSEGAPVFEEFIPLKRSSSSEAEDDIQAGDRRQHNDEDINSNCQQQERSEKKPDWLRSVQLWSQQPDPQHLPREEDDVDTPPRPIAVEAKRATGAFLPFHPQKKPSPSPSPAAVPVEVAPEGAPAAASSTSETRSGGAGGGGKSGCSGGDRKDGQPDRKVRRCWSQELHRRFLNALQQLGGSNVATPRRIRELMMVEGLTNDEVKSHLQKYRLHSRRPSSTSGGNAGNAPPPQVVFVGGIWVPPPEYEAAAEGIAAGPPRAIYAPIASVPAPKLQQQQMQQQQQQQQRSSPCRTGPSPPGDGRSCREEQTEATRSNSPATSSSSRTTTPSPPQC